MNSSSAAILTLEVIARVSIGLTLVYAGLAKAAGHSLFPNSLRHLPIPRFFVKSDQRLRATAVSVSAIEIALGSTFALGLWPYATGAFVILLLLVFSAVLIRALRDGQVATCACLGRMAQVHKRSLGRNAALVAVAFVGMQAQGTDGLLATPPLSWSPVIWALVVVCLILATVVMFLPVRVRRLRESVMRMAPKVSTVQSPSDQPVIYVHRALMSEPPLPGSRPEGQQQQDVLRDAEPVQPDGESDRQRILEERGQSRRHLVEQAQPRIPEEDDPRSCTDKVYVSTVRVLGGSTEIRTWTDTTESRPAVVRTDRDGPLRDFAYVHQASRGIRAFQMHARSRVSPQDFFSRYAEIFGLGANDVMEKYAEGVLDAGHSYAKFLQRHRGVVVDGAEGLLTHDDVVLSGTSSIVPLLDMAVRPRVAQKDALDLATEWVVKEARASDIALARLPACELLITSESASPSLDVRRKGPWRLVYRCRVVLARPWSPYTVDIDAMSGKILRGRHQREWAWESVVATGVSVYNDTVSFNAETNSEDGTSRLRSPDAETYTLEWRDLDGQRVQMEVDVLGQNGNFFEPDAAGVSLHWAAEKVTQYLFKAFKRNGIDDRGFPITQIADPFCSLDNAFFEGTLEDGPRIRYCTGFMPPAVQFDTVGHEIGHGVLWSSVGPTPYSGLGEAGEPGALNESFADIIATLAEFSELGELADWVVSYGSSVQRFFKDPKLNVPLPGPTTYGYGPWINPNSKDDNGGVHTNCNVQNYWFYLLSEGDSGTNAKGDAYDVVGIGKEKAGQIVYRSLTTKLVHGAKFLDAREAAIQSAIDLFGQYSQEAVSVANAWYAVGVGAPSQQIREPADGATDVEPWDCLLLWEWQPVLSNGCEVQISSVRDFSIDTLTIEVSLTAEHLDWIGPTPVVKTSVPLETNKQYFWRFREATRTEPELSWSPTFEFLTASKKPVVVQPTQACQGGWHPWGLPFKWEEVPGAQEYTLQVATDQQFESLLLEPIKVPVGPGFTTRQVLNVKIGSSLWWRVIAGRQVAQDRWYTATSDAIPFTTIRPKVTLTDPDPRSDGSRVYPWGLHFSWTSEIGAGSYEIEIAKDDLSNPPYFKDSLSGTEGWVDFPAQWPGQDYYVWRVTVVGPSISGIDGQFQEHGDPSDLGRFSIDGTGTIVELVYPPYQVACVPFGVPVTFRWGSVPLAQSYRLTIVELIGLPEGLHGDGEWKRGDQVFDAHYPHDGTTYEQVHTVNEVARYMSSQFSIGYFWQVQAFGPKGLPGLQGDANAYYVHPTQPLVTKPSNNGQPFASGDKVVLEWTTQMSHGGFFLVSLYDGTECRSRIFERLVAGDLSPSGYPLTTAYQLSGLKPGKQYSCRVRPVIYDGCEDTAEWSSPCIWFQVLKPLGPPAPKPICPTGGDQIPGTSAYFAWSEVPGATQYEFRITPGPYYMNSWDLTYNLDDLEGIEKGRVIFRFGYDALQVSTQYQWMVRAYVNGIWSDWAPPATFVTGPSGWNDWNTDCAYP